MRIDYRSHDVVQQAMSGMGLSAATLGLDPLLVELVKIRASQINGCAFCLDMHTKDAIAMGETAERLNLVVAWREAHCFSDTERAALRWTEELTRLPETGASDAAFDQVCAVFGEKEVVALTAAIVAINAWNRFAVGFRSEPGHYVSRYATVAINETGR
jgi:AhpD family alkylhydroperoxidase